MILKKKEIFLLIFLILLQSCSGGRIGNFLESSFNDSEKTIQDEYLQNNFINKENLVREKNEINNKNYEKLKKKKKLINFLENKKDKNLEKLQNKKNNKLKKKKKSQ